MTNLEIVLTYHPEMSREYPNGFWQATARKNGLVDHDGSGVDPLTAMTQMAKQMYEDFDAYKEGIEE